MKSPYLYNLLYNNNQLHIISPPYMRVIIPKYKTRSTIPIITTLETCLGSGSLPSKLDPCDGAPIGIGFYTMRKGGKGQGNVIYPNGHTALLLMRSGLQRSGGAPHRLGTSQHRSPNVQWKQNKILYNTR